MIGRKQKKTNKQTSKQANKVSCFSRGTGQLSLGCAMSDVTDVTSLRLQNTQQFTTKIFIQVFITQHISAKSGKAFFCLPSLRPPTTA